MEGIAQLMTYVRRVWMLMCAMILGAVITNPSAAQTLNVILVIGETDGDTIVTEFGQSDTFTVKLTSQPSAPVTVWQDFNYLPTEPSVLTFTPENWDVPQVVTVHAAHDYITQLTPTYEVSVSYVAEMWDGGAYQYARLFHNLNVTVHDAPKSIPTGLLVVTTLADSVSEEISGSLRQMMHIANARAGDDYITFLPGLAGTLTLQASLPPIGETLMILGSGQEAVTISGNHRQHSAFYSWGFSGSSIYFTLFDVTLSQLRSAVAIDYPSLMNVTVSDSGHGESLVYGYPAVFAYNRLDLHSVTMTGNSGVFGGAAGGHSGFVRDSTFSDNIAFAIPSDTLVLGGTGGALYGETYLESINNVFIGNQAEVGGGAAYVGDEFLTNMLVSIDSTYTDNSAPQGGAIMIAPMMGLIMSNTFSQNHAESGGAIYGSPSVFNSTFSANTASVSGAAIDGVATVTHSTFSGHHTDQSAGVAVVENGVVLIGSLIANNEAATPYECGASVFGFGLFSDDPNCFGTMGEATGVDPVLSDNGGLTMTHRLLAGSNAIDYDPIIEDDMTSCQYMAEQFFLIDGENLPLTDQRGVYRPDGAACDFGAYEYVHEFIFNGGFETDEAWVSKRLGTGDKRVCVSDEPTLAAPEGDCVYQFWASFRPSFNRTLIQSISGDNVNGIGDSLTLSARVEGQNLGEGAALTLHITYADGSTGKHQVAIPAGTYGYTEINTPISVSGAISEIVVRVEAYKVTGRLRLDAVSLKSSENALIPFPAIEARPGASLDLPAAPDGFRQ